MPCKPYQDAIGRMDCTPEVGQVGLGGFGRSTLDTYSHVSPGLQEAVAKRFDDVPQLGHNEVVEGGVLK
jgi:hypothetical protein